MKVESKKLPMSLVAVGIIVLAIIMAVVVKVNQDEEEKYRLLKIESYGGTVELERNSDGVEIFSGMQLLSKDTVTTREESVVELLADSDKHILAEEKTRFFVQFEGDEEKGKFTIMLEYGTSLFTIDKKLNEESEFEVNTPNATLSVRGTTFRVNYDATTNTTKLEVLDGIVEAAATNETKSVSAGEIVFIRDDEFVEGEISIQEYIIKANGITPDFSGELFLVEHWDEELGYYWTGFNRQATYSYSEACSITYVIENGDDNFTAKRADHGQTFTNEEKSFSSLTGNTYLRYHTSRFDEEGFLEKCEENGNSNWIECQRDKYTDYHTVLGVGVIVSDESQINDGVLALEGKINDLKYKGFDYDVSQEGLFHEIKGNDKWFGLTMEEYAKLVGECFQSTGYIVSNIGEGDIIFLENSDGGISIQSNQLKEGDILVFFSLDDVLLNPVSTAIYSEMQQGIYEGGVYNN